jgi:hypothetical protein
MWLIFDETQRRESLTLQVGTAVIIMPMYIWDVTSCYLVGGYQHSEELAAIIFRVTHTTRHHIPKDCVIPTECEHSVYLVYSYSTVLKQNVHICAHLLLISSAVTGFLYLQ